MACVSGLPVARTRPLLARPNLTLTRGGQATSACSTGGARRVLALPTRFAAEAKPLFEILQGGQRLGEVVGEGGRELGIQASRAERLGAAGRLGHRSDQSLGPLTGTLGGPPAVRTGGDLPGRDRGESFDVAQVGVGAGEERDRADAPLPAGAGTRTIRIRLAAA